MKSDPPRRSSGVVRGRNSGLRIKISSVTIATAASRPGEAAWSGAFFPHAAIRYREFVPHLFTWSAEEGHRLAAGADLPAGSKRVGSLRAPEPRIARFSCRNSSRSTSPRGNSRNFAVRPGHSLQRRLPRVRPSPPVVSVTRAVRGRRWSPTAFLTRAGIGACLIGSQSLSRNRSG